DRVGDEQVGVSVDGLAHLAELGLLLIGEEGPIDVGRHDGKTVTGSAAALVGPGGEARTQSVHPRTLADDSLDHAAERLARMGAEPDLLGDLPCRANRPRVEAKLPPVLRVADRLVAKDDGGASLKVGGGMEQAALRRARLADER